MKHIALIYANANYRRILMNNMFLYFAYGSNMNPARMAKRCPGAIALGGAVLLNHRLAERLYADIDFVSGSTVEGVLYLISEANLTRLDVCEGYPKVYRRLWLEVEFDGGIYQAITYEMSRWTKFIRRSKRYPEEYRKICSFGADYYGIKNNFKK